MTDIKIIEKDTDLSQVKMDKIGWDVEIHDKPYDVYQIEGFVHHIGGKRGENDYWCCPADETPSVDNLIEFDGYPVLWGVEYIPYNYCRTKWDETEVDDRGKTIIKRNNKTFYIIQARSMHYGIAKAQAYVVELSEHPIAFHMRKFREEMIGRKIWYENQPAIIERLFEDENEGISLWIVPDKTLIEKFEFPTWQKGEWERNTAAEWSEGLRADLLESDIDWFRE
jgi:hypothetical protein